MCSPVSLGAESLVVSLSVATVQVLNLIYLVEDTSFAYVFVVRKHAIALHLPVLLHVNQNNCPQHENSMISQVMIAILEECNALWAFFAMVL